MKIHALAARVDLHREHLRLAVLPTLQFVAPAGQFHRRDSPLPSHASWTAIRSAVNRQNTTTGSSLPISSSVSARSFCLLAIDAMDGVVVGRHAASGHLLEAQKLHHRVRGRYGPVLHARHEVLFEIPVDPGGFAGQIAVVRDVRGRRQIEHFVADPERDPAHQAFQFVELLEAGNLLPLVAAHDRVLRAGTALNDGPKIVTSRNRNMA